MEETKQILLEWKKKFTQIDDFNTLNGPYRTNVIKAIENIHTLATLVKASQEKIKQNCKTYIEQNRKRLFLQYWLSTARKYLYNHLYNHGRLYESTTIHPNFEYEWLKAVQQETMDRYDASYENAKKLVFNAINEFGSPSQEELDKHKDIACDTDDWFGCWLCEKIEANWKKQLQDQVRNSNNIFVNKSLQEEFINYMLSENRFQISDEWVPPDIYGYDYKLGEIILTEGHYYIHNEIQRKGAFNENKTAVQNMKNLLEIINSSWNLYYERDLETKSEFKIFIYIWSFIDVFPYIIDLDLALCKKIEETFLTY